MVELDPMKTDDPSVLDEKYKLVDEEGWIWVGRSPVRRG